MSQNKILESIARNLEQIIGSDSSWTGAAIRVRRSPDYAEADISFMANGDLDTAALLAFVGNGSGFMTWYDQSGNGCHATAANQPRDTQRARKKLTAVKRLLTRGKNNVTK
jgi:hypothetical protein